MENSEEKLYCPFCRCELTDLKATTCPKCWGDLTQFLEDNPVESSEAEEQEKQEEPNEEAQSSESTEEKANDKKAPKNEKTEKKASKDEKSRFKYACFASLVIFLLVQIFFLYKIDKNSHKIYKELQEINYILQDVG